MNDRNDAGERNEQVAPGDGRGVENPNQQQDQANIERGAGNAEQSKEAQVDERTGIDGDSESTSVWVWLGGLAAGVIVIAYLAVAYSLGYDRGERHGERVSSAAQRAPSKPTTSTAAVAGPGKQLFAATCGSCHTLRAAGTSGHIGPNLDQLKPDEARVLAAIRNGGTGQGIMPTNIYTGKQAQQVAAFVSQAAGR
jgi:cytochrome c6